MPYHLTGAQQTVSNVQTFSEALSAWADALWTTTRDVLFMIQSAQCYRPTPDGTKAGSFPIGAASTLVGPMLTPKGITLQIKNNIKYPCYHIRGTLSLKDK